MNTLGLAQFFNKINKPQSNKSILWARVKSIGNSDLKWSSKQQDMQAFLDKHAQEQQIQSVYFSTAQTKDKDLAMGVHDSIKNFIAKQQPGSIIRVNNQIFKLTDNKKSDVQRVFEMVYNGEDLILDTVETYDIDPEENDQIYRYGDQNCLLHPIKKIFQDKHDTVSTVDARNRMRAILNKIKKFEQAFNIQGATPQLIQQLADITKSKITIYEVITQTKQQYKYTKGPRHYKFKFQNISLNHVNIWQNNVAEQQIVDNIYDTQDQLIQSGQTFKYTISDGHLIKLNDGMNIYVNSEYNSLLEAEQQINDITKQFTITLATYAYIDGYMQSNPQIEFINSALQTSGVILLKNTKIQSDQLQHIDMKKSYSQHINLPQKYKFGVPFITDYRKVTNTQFALEHNGLYQCTITNMSPVMKAIFGDKSTQILFSNMIQFLVDNDAKIQVIGGMYGFKDQNSSRQTDKINENNMPECFKKFLGRSAYFTAFSKYGIVQKDTRQESIYCPDKKLAGIIRNNLNYRMQCYDENHYTIEHKNEYQQRFRTRMHVYAYVLQCQQINMMLQLNNMNMNKVVLLAGDDIYFEKHEFQMLDIFRPKGKNNFEILKQQADKYYLRQPYPLEQTLKYGDEQPVQYMTQLHQGPGGHGKTYKQLTDLGSIGIIYTTLTNALVDDQKQSITKPLCYTTEMLKIEQLRGKINCQTLIIDECSLLSVNQLIELQEKFQYSKIYVLGDDLQIQGQDGQLVFDSEHYDIIFDESNYQTDYRAINCSRLQQIKNDIRKDMRNNMSERDLYYKHIVPNSNQQKYAQFFRQYDTSQMIVTCSNLAKDTYTEALKRHQKYRVNRCFIHNDIKYNTGQILYELPQGFDYESDCKNIKPKLKLQHAFTCHSLQGMTHNNKLVVTVPQQHEVFRGYCYTAISRLTKIQDLFTLNF